MSDDAAARERIRAVLQIDDLDRGGTRLEGLVLEPGDAPGEYRVCAGTTDGMGAATRLLPIAGALTRCGYGVAGQRVGDRAWLRVRPAR